MDAKQVELPAQEIGGQMTRRKEWAAENKEKLREYKHAWNISHKDHIRQYYAANKEKINAKRRESVARERAALKYIKENGIVLPANYA